MDTPTAFARHENLPDRPDYRNPDYEECLPLWDKAGDVWQGVRALRKKKYLAQFHKEDPADYKTRADNTEFFNVFRGTVQTVVGLVFKSQILPEEAPTSIENLYPDVDLMGNDLSTFLRQTFTRVVRDGVAFILVDAPPPVEPNSDGSTPTLSDVRGRRPFWRNYSASQVVNWRHETINGVERLVQATLYETMSEPDGAYGVKQVEQWRTLRPGSWQVFRKNDQAEFYEVAGGATGIGDIPLVAVQANKRDLFCADPPYMELLETNLVHYNSVAVLREALRYIVPMPVFTVDSKDDAQEFQKMTVGANRSIILWGANPTAQYLELEGKSVEELRIDIETLESRMARQGVEKFAPVEGSNEKTAFEVGSDNRRQMSEIAVMAKHFEDAVETVFKFTGDYINAITGGGTVDMDNQKVRLVLDYDKLTFNSEQMKFIAGLVDTNKLSRSTFLKMLPHIVDMPEWYDAEIEAEQLTRELIDQFPVI